VSHLILKALRLVFQTQPRSVYQENI
jgi:hypothetical protein